MSFLYEWITKPYIQWTFIDRIISGFEIILIITIILYVWYKIVNR